MTKKHVSFAATKTVAEFHIAHNPTTVPHVGPSVGLVGPPICISSVPILDDHEVVATHGKKRRALYMEPVRRVVMLRRQGYSMEDIGRICIQADYVKQCRKETALAYLVERGCSWSPNRPICMSSQTLREDLFEGPGAVTRQDLYLT